MQRYFVLPLLFMFISLPILAGNFPQDAAAAEKFGGVGIDGVPLQSGEIRVRQLVSGGPAHRAGIRIGDVITHIDGRPTRGSNFREVVNKMLRGNEGTVVRLTVERGSGKSPLQFNMVRRQLITYGR